MGKKLFILITAVFSVVLIPNVTAPAEASKSRYIHSITMHLPQKELNNVYFSLNIGYLDSDPNTFCNHIVEIRSLKLNKVKDGDTIDIDSKIIPKSHDCMRDCMFVYFSHESVHTLKRVGFALVEKKGEYVDSYPKRSHVILEEE